MGLVDYVLCELQQEAVHISYLWWTYDEQIKVAKLEAFKRRAKCFILNSNNYMIF